MHHRCAKCHPDCKRNRGLIEASIREHTFALDDYDALDVLRDGITSMRTQTNTGAHGAKTLETSVIGRIERRTRVLRRAPRTGSRAPNPA